MNNGSVFWLVYAKHFFFFLKNTTSTHGVVGIGVKGQGLCMYLIYWHRMKNMLTSDRKRKEKLALSNNFNMQSM